MPQTLAFIHTLAALAVRFDALAAERLPGVGRIHTVDEPLLQAIQRRGRLTGEDKERLESHVLASAKAGAGVVLITCSTISPCVDQLEDSAHPPVVKIDQAMFAEAIRRGRRIGVVATHEATIGPTTDGLRAEARRAGREIKIESAIAAGAIEARQQDRYAEHDRLVADAAAAMAPRCDIVVLAQASMAGAAAVAAPAVKEKLLTSPETALRAIHDLLRLAPSDKAGA